MPVTNGIGHSDWTPEKQDMFRRFLGIHFRMAKTAMAKHKRTRYYYFDLNAGTGVTPDGKKDGSPLIFIQEAERAAIEYNAHMIEVNPDNFKCLDRNLAYFGIAAYRSRAILADHNDYMASFCVPRYRGEFGLFYTDPTGIDDLPFETLARLSHYWGKADILMALSAANLKRVGVAHGRPRLIDYLRSIKKRRWVIREPRGKHQWTFLYGTNGPAPRWAKQGWHPVTSPEGTDILLRLSLTREEYDRWRQPQLPLL